MTNAPAKPGVIVVDPCPMDEAIASTPAYGAVTRRYPDARRALVTTEENALLFRGDPNFDDIVGVPVSAWGWFSPRWLAVIRRMRRNGYQVAVALNGGRKMRLFASLVGISDRYVAEPADPVADPLDRKMALLETLGCTSRRRTPSLIPSRGDERYVHDMLAGSGMKGDGRYIVFVPDETWTDSFSPKSLAGVVDQVAAIDPAISLFFSGIPATRGYAESVIAECSQSASVLYLSPGHFLAFCSMCELFVGSPGLHASIAAACGTRVIDVRSNPGGSRVPGGLAQREIAANLADSIHRVLDRPDVQTETTRVRRWTDSEAFRRRRGDANLFLRTAP